MTPREREIRERMARATPGPWTQDSYLSGTEYIRFQDAPSENQYGRGSLGCHISYRNIATFGMTESECEKRKWADANFIAHAPEDIAYLLAQLTTAREIIEVAKEYLRKIDDPMKHHHWEEDPYTRAGCFQFVAQEGLKKITEMEKEK